MHKFSMRALLAALDDQKRDEMFFVGIDLTVVRAYEIDHRHIGTLVVGQGLIGVRRVVYLLW
jgi:hypothetical protein